MYQLYTHTHTHINAFTNTYSKPRCWLLVNTFCPTLKRDWRVSCQSAVLYGGLFITACVASRKMRSVEQIWTLPNMNERNRDFTYREVSHRARNMLRERRPMHRWFYPKAGAARTSWSIPPHPRDRCRGNRNQRMTDSCFCIQIPLTDTIVVPNLNQCASFSRLSPQLRDASRIVSSDNVWSKTVTFYVAVWGVPWYKHRTRRNRTARIAVTVDLSLVGRFYTYVRK